MSAQQDLLDALRPIRDTLSRDFTYLLTALLHGMKDTISFIEKHHKALERLAGTTSGLAGVSLDLLHWLDKKEKDTAKGLDPMPLPLYQMMDKLRQPAAWSRLVPARG